MNAVILRAVIEAEENPVPADLAYLARGGQRCRRASAMHVGVLDNHLRVLGSLACAVAWPRPTCPPTCPAFPAYAGLLGLRRGSRTRGRSGQGTASCGFIG